MRPTWAARPALARPLGTWPEDAASFRDLNVGPSHLVRFVEADYVLYALKELPSRIADKEYRVLRDLQIREPRRPGVGLVDQPDTGNSILVTEYLEHSWQFRRLFRRLPRELVKHRERLLDAIAGLLVDLHREGCTGATARCPTPCSSATASCSRRSWSTPRPARSTWS